MKGVNWSKTRKILEAITVCLGITTMVNRGHIKPNGTIATAMTATKVLPQRAFSVPDSTAMLLILIKLSVKGQ
jgi:urease alpha subunit